jgi:hypothetical protein
MGLVIFLGPGLVSGGRSAPPSPDQSLQPTPVTGLLASTPPVAPLIWAPRGTGIGTPFAVAAMAQARAQRPDVDKLLWAGSVDGRDRVALVSVTPSRDSSIIDGVEIVALRVPAGSRLAQARLQSMGSVRGLEGRVGAAWVGADGHTRLLVVGRPHPMTVDVSAVIKYRPDGSIGRKWRPVSSRDGVVIVDLGHQTDPVLVVRPFRKTPGENFLVSVGHPAQAEPARLRIQGDTAATYAGPDPGVLSRGVADAVSSLVDVRRTTARVIWSGAIEVGAQDAAHHARLSGRGALVLLRRDDGPVFQAFVFIDDRGHVNSSSANAVPWAAGDRLPYVFSTYQEGTPLLVLNPSGAGSVTVAVRPGATATMQTDRNGVGVLDDDASHSLGFGGSDVVVRDPRGRAVLHSRLVDVSTVDPFGLYL